MEKQIPLLQLGLALAICCVLIGGWKQPEPGSYGVVVLPIVKMQSYGCRFLSDRNLVVEVRADGTLRINETGPLFWPEARELLKRIFAARDEKVIYLRAERNVSYSDYVSLVADAHADVPGMKVVAITSVDEARPLEDSCYYGYKGDPDFEESAGALSGKPL